MPVQFRDYYETLGVPKTASEDEIRSAFRKLARKHHPDVAKDKTAAEEKFKEINEAYGGLGGRQATAERGADVEADIMVTLEEALNGSTRTVSLRRAGSNKVENYQVKIPRGVREGQRIRLAGQGEAGVGGGKSGDLFLRVRLARHPDFSVEGSDLIHEVKIEPWRAVLGGELLVPTLEGKVRLKIPPGTQGGQRFRLRERGLSGVSGKRGDLYVEVKINVPKKLSEREREIWNELAKLHGA